MNAIVQVVTKYSVLLTCSGPFGQCDIQMQQVLGLARLVKDKDCGIGIVIGIFYLLLVRVEHLQFT